MVVHANVDEDAERRVRRSFEKQGLQAKMTRIRRRSMATADALNRPDGAEGRTEGRGSRGSGVRLRALWLFLISAEICATP
jgi:hypothetical protein